MAEPEARAPRGSVKESKIAKTNPLECWRAQSEMTKRSQLIEENQGISRCEAFAELGETPPGDPRLFDTNRPRVQGRAEELERKTNPLQKRDLNENTRQGCRQSVGLAAIAI
jgi:hypothetical protein